MSKNVLCTQCRTEITPKMETPGHFAIELALWFVFLLPGFIYSIWRLIAKKKICPVCSSTTFVPLNSPAARSIRGDNTYQGAL